MNRKQFHEIEQYMLVNMRDSAHDSQHIYRVLYAALDIAGWETGVDLDVLVAACLLHDIGRDAQLKDPTLCHAQVGGEMAFQYLRTLGWEENRASLVRACIISHRYRGDNAPETVEAKILFDADKLDVSGVIGVARTLIYKGEVSEPLYTVRDDGSILEGEADRSFLYEYRYKLNQIYDRFYTKRGSELALQRKQHSEEFYQNLVNEISSTIDLGKQEMERLFSQSMGE